MREQARLAIVAEGAGGDGRAGHVVVDGETDSELPEIFFIAARRADLRAQGKPTERSPLMPIESTWPAVGPMRTTELEIGGFQRQNPAFVLEQHGGIFAGLLDDPGVGFDGLRRDFVFGLAVEIAEVDDFIEHTAGGAGDGGFGDGAVFERLAASFSG